MEVAIDPEEARRIAAEGPKLSKADLAKMEKEDSIQQSLNARKATGAVNNTIPLAKDAQKEIIFILKQTGDKLNVADIVIAVDPEEARRLAAEGPKLSKADLQRLEKEDDI